MSKWILIVLSSFLGIVSGCDDRAVHDHRMNADRQRVGLRELPSTFSKQVDHRNYSIWSDGQGTRTHPPPRYKKKVLFFDQAGALESELDLFESEKTWQPSSGPLRNELLHIEYSWYIAHQGGDPWKFSYVSEDGKKVITEVEAEALLAEWGLSRSGTGTRKGGTRIGDGPEKGTGVNRQ